MDYEDLYNKIVERTSDKILDKIFDDNNRQFNKPKIIYDYWRLVNDSEEDNNPCKNCPNYGKGVICNCVMPYIHGVRYTTTVSTDVL